MIDKINLKYKDNIRKFTESSVTIQFSIFDEYIKDLINDWYIVLWYDVMIINDEWTLSPINLTFDFSRNINLSNEINELALTNLQNLNKKIKEGNYNIEEVYIYIVYKKS